ncbi:hypothetical protein [Kaarinaea lacus]
MKQQVQIILFILISIVVMVITVSPVLAHDEVTDPTKTDYQSRFKIFTAEHEAITRSGKIDKVQSIFKIDLETGTVWRYRQGVDQKGKPFEEFFEVPNQ